MVEVQFYYAESQVNKELADIGTFSTNYWQPNLCEEQLPALAKQSSVVLTSIPKYWSHALQVASNTILKLKLMPQVQSTRRPKQEV